MRAGGTAAPRRKVGVGGCLVRWAQSSGEWPGSSTTFFEGRFAGARVDVEGASEGGEEPRDRDGGGRRLEAADGGGCSVEGARGRGRREGVLEDV